MFCSTAVRQPLADLNISRQMEHQNEKKFNNLIQDTVFRLQNCMRLVDTPEPLQKALQSQRTSESSPEQSENIPTSSQEDVEAAKKRAKKARRRGRKDGKSLCDEMDQLQISNKSVADENTNPNENDPINHIRIESYKDESQIGVIMDLIGKELSEPYSIYTYRYFLNTWPELTLIAYDTRVNKYIGVVVCKIDVPGESAKIRSDDEQPSKGYIAMLAVDETHRGSGIGTRLVKSVIDRMHKAGCDEIILETEVSNTKALNLYSRLGFIREKKLFRYYLNNGDAYRLVLYNS